MGAAQPPFLKRASRGTITNTAAECRGYRCFASQPRCAFAVADPLRWGVGAAQPPQIQQRNWPQKGTKSHKRKPRQVSSTRIRRFLTRRAQSARSGDGKRGCIGTEICSLVFCSSVFSESSVCQKRFSGSTMIPDHPAGECHCTGLVSPYIFLCILVPFCGCLNCFFLFSSALRAGLPRTRQQHWRVGTRGEDCRRQRVARTGASGDAEIDFQRKPEGASARERDGSNERE